jgi:hypothetical protein
MSDWKSWSELAEQYEADLAELDDYIERTSLLLRRGTNIGKNTRLLGILHAQQIEMVLALCGIKECAVREKEEQKNG